MKISRDLGHAQGSFAPQRYSAAAPTHLLILDPLIRLHRVDENDATQIAALLSFLRELQRNFQVAVMLGSSRPQRLPLQPPWPSAARFQ
jgi:hypothetical protein